jgi:hypothetical protein
MIVSDAAEVGEHQDPWRTMLLRLGLPQPNCRCMAPQKSLVRQRTVGPNGCAEGRVRFARPGRQAGDRVARMWGAEGRGRNAPNPVLALCDANIVRSSDLEHSVDQLAHPLGSFAADGAYDQDRVYQAVAEHDPDAAVMFRRGQPWCRVPRPKRLRRSATATCEPLQSGVAWPGNKPAATICGPKLRQRSVDTTRDW